MEARFLDGRVVVKVGDITEESTDAIVNAANGTLLGGVGVDGAIHDRGGPQILAQCEQIRATTFPEGVPTGEAVITTGGNLKAKYVIHTVGPIYGQNENDAALLAKCYEGCLSLAIGNGLVSIAFPSISTGAFYYPKHEAASVASSAIKKVVESSDAISKVHLLFFSDSDAKMFLKHQKFQS